MPGTDCKNEMLRDFQKALCCDGIPECMIARADAGLAINS